MMNLSVYFIIFYFNISILGDFHFVDAYRPEFYDTLSEIFHNCTDGYIKSRGRAPQKIVLFYNGLTEGQLVRTYKFAIPLIKEGIRRGCGTEIHLTVIGVQKKNGVRLFPEEVGYKIKITKPLF
jgi:hypothetical protein